MARASIGPRTAEKALGALGALLLLLAAYLICRNAVILSIGRAAPELAAKFAPAPGEALMRMHLRPQGQQAGAARAAIEAGMQRAPLSQIPFLIASETARREGKEELADRLGQEAILRHSRNEYGRGKMLQHHLLRGQWSQAIQEMRVLWREAPQAPTVLTPLIVAMAEGDIRARALLLRALNEDAGWRSFLRAEVRKTGKGEPFLGALEAYGKDGPPRPSLSPDGYIGWVAGLPSSELRKVGTVFDGAFEGGTGESYFSWRLAPSARITKDGLEVSDAGAGELAAQHLVLPPGRYRMDIESSRPAQGPGGLHWALQCLDGARLAAIPLPSPRHAPRARAEFTVPQDCPIQRLTLAGGGGGRTTATFRRVAIVPIL